MCQNPESNWEPEDLQSFTLPLSYFGYIIFFIMKEIIKILKFQLQAGKATSAPPLGPLLTSLKINPNTFVKDFNEKTKQEKGLRNVIIFIYSDKTFDFKILSSPISKLILEKLKLEKGSSHSKDIICEMKTEEFLSIFNEKKKDFPNLKDESLKKMILGTAKNMGVILHT